MLQRLILVAVIWLITCPAYAVKTLKLSFGKEQPVVVEIPSSEWTSKETSWAGNVPISVFHADEDVLKTKKWQNGQLPLLTEFHVEKAQECGTGISTGRIVGCPAGWRQLELRSGIAWLKIQFPPETGDIETSLREIVFIGSLSEFESTPYLHDKVFAPNQGVLFSAVPSVSEEDRFRLFKFGVTSGFTVMSTEFKDHKYVELLVPSTSTFNTIRTNQDERVATVLKDVALPQAKAILPLITGKPVDGVALKITIPAYNFLNGGEEKFDELAVYLRSDRLKAFTESDITSQQLINDSFVLLNGDRVEAKL